MEAGRPAVAAADVVCMLVSTFHAGIDLIRQVHKVKPVSVSQMGKLRPREVE